MVSIRKNRSIFLDRQALATLSFAQEGIFKPVDRLMNKEEALEVENTGRYKGKPFPFPFILAPAGKRNREVITSLQKGETIDLIVGKKVRGQIKAEGFFEINRVKRIEQIFGNYDTQNRATRNFLRRLGEYSIYGKYEVDYDGIKKVKEQIKNAIKDSSAKTVAAIMMDARPFNRAHERLLRITLERTDLVIVFLSKHANQKNKMTFEQKYEMLQYAISNYLPKNRVLVVPFESTYLFAGYNDAILDCISANNFGCNKFIIGKNHSGIGMYYDKNEMKSILSKYESLDIEIEVISRFVYCQDCKTLVNTNTCPHGSHRHIKYNSSAIRQFFKVGILPPAVLMRTDVSSKLLSACMSNRFKNINKLYDDIFPNNGLLEDHSEEEFYLNLMKLHQTTSLT